MALKIYNNIFSQLNHAVLIADKKCQIISVNNSLLRLFGYSSSDDLIGESIKVLIPDEHARKHDSYVKNYEKTRKSVIIGRGRKLLAKHCSGKLIPIFIIVSIDSLTGNYIVIINDMAEEFKRDAFLSFICHELRNPLQGVMGLSELLLFDKKENDPDYKKLKGIHNSAILMKHITDDVLDLSKIYAGKLSLEIIPINFEGLINDVLSQSGDPKPDVFITTSLSKDILNGNILGDPTRLNQILNNLLSNAIKFTIQGMINIAVDIGERDEKYVFVKFKVQDTGIGIAPDNIKYLFEAFSQEKASITRKFGGTGLGLSICNQLVKLMKGNKIEVKSKLGVGSIFYFTLPMKYIKAIKTETKITKILHSVKNLNHDHKILIVEDNEINQEILETILKKMNYQVDIADNGLSGFHQFQNGNYKCIFMDIEMPVMNGIETTEKIRLFEKNDKIPIIATTGSVMGIEKQRYFQAGVNYIIEKPYSEKEIIEVIEKILK